MEPHRNVWTWFWPAPIARRLGLVLACSTAYTLLVYAIETMFDLGRPAWVGEFTAVSTFVISVLVGFRTKAAYDRWWEGRNLWGQLTNHSRNLCLKATRLAGPAEADRRELFRLVAGFPVALMNHLRLGVKLQEVPGFEADPDTPAHVPAYLAGRAIALVNGWRAAGAIDGHALQVLDPHLVAYMDICGACEKIRNTPLPASYLLLLRHGLALSLLFIPWNLAYALGLWALPVQALIIYFLVGVELIAEEVEQPFADDPDDLPLERYCQTVRTNAAEILGVADGG